MPQIDVTALPDAGKAPAGFPAGASAYRKSRFRGVRAAYLPSRRFSIVTIWARVQGACGISRLSAPLRIAAFAAHAMASSAYADTC